MVRRFKAKTKRQKCKYKRCTYKKTLPIEKPKYCERHFLFLGLGEPEKKSISSKIAGLLFKSA